MTCLLWHRWRLIGTVPFTDTSWGQSMPMTQLVERCDLCRRLRDRRRITGTWTVEDLK